MAEKQATINLPEGMDAAKVKAIIASYEKKQKTQGGKNKAKRDAVKSLIAAHKPEYDTFLAAAKKRHGVADKT
jgi:hypothetical protein